MKEKIYIETSIPSYLTARTSKDMFVYTHQEITKHWWDKERKKYDLFISLEVLNEIKRGDNHLALKRIEAIKDCIVLDDALEIKELAEKYLINLNLSPKALTDCYHIAYAVLFKMDFMLSWNCKHIVNAHTILKLEKYNLSHDLKTPIICTPETIGG